MQPARGMPGSLYLQAVMRNFAVWERSSSAAPRGSGIASGEFSEDFCGGLLRLGWSMLKRKGQFKCGEMCWSDENWIQSLLHFPM